MDDLIRAGVEARKKRQKKNRIMKRAAIVAASLLLVIFIAVVAGSIALAWMKSSGRGTLLKGASNQAPSLALTETESAGADQPAQKPLEEGYVRYNGKVYRYNEDIINILCLGVDNKGEVEQKDEIGLAGQADTLFLLSMDTRNKTMKLISINRDTMTDIAVYDFFGNYVSNATAQLALAYSYGDGAAKSCELTVEAVSNLLYQLPIHAYCSINMDAIPVINDMVGGVEVTINDDFSKVSKRMKQGETITLKGGEALIFVRSRMDVGNGTNEERMARQKQYMLSFVSSAKAAMKKDLTFPIKLFNGISEYLVTDISLNEITYLATQALESEFTSDSMLNIQGTSQMGERYMEFYVDDEALYDLIIDVFYEEDSSYEEDNSHE